MEVEEKEKQKLGAASTTVSHSDNASAVGGVKKNIYEDESFQALSQNPELAAIL